jgi:poly(ADP-ribose) glycohydrolase
VQELIAALLSCSFLCLFPTGCRNQEMLPEINWDRLYGYVLQTLAQGEQDSVGVDRKGTEGGL